MAKHADCAAAWRDQTGNAKNAGTLFYRGDTIYSYGGHFPIARLVTVGAETVVLITTAGYSASTSTHKGIVREAVKAMECFDVPDVMAATEPKHAANHAAMLRAARDLDAKGDKARTLGQSWYLQAEAKRRSAYRYAALFGVPTTETE